MRLGENKPIHNTKYQVIVEPPPDLTVPSVPDLQIATCNKLTLKAFPVLLLIKTVTGCPWNKDADVRCNKAWLNA
jgi:hypothetical protein